MHSLETYTPPTARTREGGKTIGIFLTYLLPRDLGADGVRHLDSGVSV